MVKKIYLIATFVLLILLISLTIAQDLQGIGEGLEKGVKGIEEKKEQIEELSPEKIKQDYINKERLAILEKTSVGRFFIWISNNVLTPLDPLFKIVLGIEHSLSWAFVFSALIWLVLFGIIFYVAWAIFNSLVIGLVASALITSIIGITGVIKKAIDLLSVAITNLWLALLSLIITIIIAIILGKFIKQNIEKEKELSKKEQLERERKIIHTEAEAAKKDLESRNKDKGAK